MHSADVRGPDAGNCPYLSTGNFPHAFWAAARDDARMSNHAVEAGQRASCRAAELNLTDREASLDASGKPDLIRDMKRGRMPNAERLSALAVTLKTSTDYLLGKADSSVALDDVGVAPIILDRLPRDVPVYGTALGADIEVREDGHTNTVEQMVVEYHDPIDMLKRPPGIANNRNVYGLYVAGSSMYPRYEEGHPLYVDGKRPPRIGDDVIVQVARTDGDGNPEMTSALVKRLVRRSATFVELEQFNPPMTFRITLTQILRIHRVIPLAELLGM